MNALIVLLLWFLPQDPAADLHRKAEQHFQAGRYEEAVAAWREFLKIQPGTPARPDVLRRLASCFEKLNRPDHARAAYRELLQLPRSPVHDSRRELTLLIARSYEREKRWAEALREYEEAAELPPTGSCIVPDPTNQYLKLDRARCLAGLGRNEEAKGLFDDVFLHGEFRVYLPGPAVRSRIAIAASEDAIEVYERQLRLSAERRPREPGPPAVLTYVRILKRRAAGDIEALWTELNELEIAGFLDSRYDWEQLQESQQWLADEAVEALAASGDIAVDFLESRARFGFNYGRCALVALARVDTERARGLIRDLKWVEGYKPEDLARVLARIAAAPRVPRNVPTFTAAPVVPLNLDREMISGALGARLSSAIPELVDLLARGTPVSRTHAVAEAGRHWRKGLVTGEELEPLWEMAQKGQWTLDWRSLVNLAAHDRMEILARVVAPALRHSDPQVRVRAAEVMSRHGHPSAIRDLAAHLEDPHYDLRRAVLDGLARPEAIEHADRVARYLVNPEPSLRYGAAFTLSRMKATRFIADISRLLKDDNGAVRTNAVQALDRLGARSYADQVRPLLKDGSDHVQRAARQFLERHAGEDLSGLDLPGLKEADPKVRTEALRRIGSRGDRSHAKAVAVLLEDRDPAVRTEACTALGMLGAPEHIPALARALKDPAMRAMACWSLGRMAAIEHGGEIVPLLSDEAEWTRIKAAGALARMGLTEHAGKIAALLKDPSAWVRGSAALKLAVLGSREHVPDLVRMLDTDPESRSSVLDALALLEARDREDAIAMIAKDGDEDDALAAARVLALWGAKDKAPLVRRLLKVEDEFTRSQAALYLAMMGDVESVPELERLEKGRDPRAAWAASCALLRMGRKTPAAERDLLVTAIDRDKEPHNSNQMSDMLKALTKRHGRETWEKLDRIVETQEAIVDEAGLRKLLETVGLRLLPMEGVRLWCRIPPSLKMSAWGIITRMLDDRPVALLPEGDAFKLTTPADARAWWVERLK